MIISKQTVLSQYFNIFIKFEKKLFDNQYSTDSKATIIINYDKLSLIIYWQYINYTCNYLFFFFLSISLKYIYGTMNLRCT